MSLFVVVLAIVLINWFFGGLFGLWPAALLGGLKFVLGYAAIAVIIILFSWGFGE